MDNMVKVVGIIQARMSSSRLPGKVMLDLGGKTLLERVVENVKKSSSIDEIIIATSMCEEDTVIEHVAKRLDVKCIRGSLEHVFSRFKKAIIESNADIVVRVTADNPLTNANLIDVGINQLQEKSLDYVSFKNVPVGTAVEVFNANTFLLINESILNSHNIEHVTSYFYQNRTEFNIEFIEDFYEKDMSHISVTVDTLADYVKVYSYFSGDLEGVWT